MRPISRPRLALAFLLLAPVLCSPSFAADKAAANAAEEKFLRFIDDNEGGGRLETVIATYKNDQGVTVHLVSAVHVGESKYFQDLARTFKTYDALLYEMVKDKDAPVPAPGAAARSDSMISVFQRLLKDVLELEFQLDAIDYSARNFVHADLTAEEFTRLQSERGESILGLMLRAMLDEMAKPTAAPDITLPELLVAFTSPDRSRHLKLMLARQFEDMEAKIAGLEGKEGTVILTERNKAALKALKESIAAGRRNIGLFYGAAHMPDIGRRLTDMGFNRVSSEWRVAWDMTAKEGDLIIKRVGKKPQPAAVEN